MPGLDRTTGRDLSGWDHVLQSLGVIFSTGFHERLMLRWFGSLVPHLLGETMSERKVVRFFYAIAVAIDLWEPRFRLVRIAINEATRSGRLSFRLEGAYYPNAHLGDYLTEHRRSLVVIAGETGVTLTRTSEAGAAS